MSLTTSYTYRHTHGPTAVSALHRVWQSHALAWLLRNGHSPSGATAVTLCVLKVVIPLQTHKTHKQFNTCTQEKLSFIYSNTNSYSFLAKVARETEVLYHWMWTIDLMIDQ